MEEYKKMWRNYAIFSGRSTVRDYWMAVLMNFVISCVVSAIAILIKFPLLYTVYTLATFIPGLSLMVRRLHDTNRSGWYWFMSLIPVAGIIILIVILASDSKDEGNNYGDIVQ